MTRKMRGKEEEKKERNSGRRGETKTEGDSGGFWASCQDRPDAEALADVRMAHHCSIGAGDVAYLDAGYFSAAAGSFLDFSMFVYPFSLLLRCV